MAEIHVESGRLECYGLLMSATNTFVIIDKVIADGVAMCTSPLKKALGNKEFHVLFWFHIECVVF